MRAWLAAAVALLGMTITVAGGIALYNYGIVADETGISGRNPALWIVLLAGTLTAFAGGVQFIQAMNAVSSPGRARK